MGGSTKSEARSTRILAYTWDCVVGNAEGYNLSAVLSSWRPLCYEYADGPQQFTVSSPLKNVTNTHSVNLLGQRTICYLLARYMLLVRNRKKQETIWLKTVDFTAEKQTWNQTQNEVDQSSEKKNEPEGSTGDILRGHQDPSYLYFILLFTLFSCHDSCQWQKKSPKYHCWIHGETKHF